MDGDPKSLKMAVEANEKMLEDLARRLSDVSDSSNLALSMAVLNQARYIHEGTKWTFQLAQEHEENAKQLLREAEWAAEQDSEETESQDDDDTNQILDMLEKQGMYLGSKLGELVTKHDLDALRREMQHSVRDEVRQLAVKRVQPKPSSDVIHEHKASIADVSSSLSGEPAAASASSDTTGPARKRRRDDEIQTASPAHPVALTEEQRKGLRVFAKARSVLDSVLDKLLPCPDGGLWEADSIHLRCLELFHSKKHATNLATFMSVQQLRTWCCMRRVAKDGFNPVSPAGKCNRCGAHCVQIRRVAADGGPASQYYYVRVVYRDPPVQ